MPNKLSKQIDNDIILDEFRTGFVAIIGMPNVGKSTLLNSLLDRKISITSNKPQTTRNRVVGVLNRPQFQIVFVDTPGIHNSPNIFNSRIVNIALSAITDVDLILFVSDVSNTDSILEKTLIDKIRTKGKKIIFVLNKIDKVDKFQLLKIIDDYSNSNKLNSIVPICALAGYQLEPLVNTIQNYIPKGSKVFPSNSFTSMSDEFMVSEIIREKVFRLTGQEIPYSVAVTIDSYKKKNSILHIYATIHVERDSQKAIIVGKRGLKLSNIGKNSRLEIEKLVSSKVFIKLFVRTQKNWSRDTKALRKFGY